MNVFWTSQASDDMFGFPQTVAERIFEKVSWYAAQQDPLSFAVRLQGRRLGSYRFRIGGYRVIFDVNCSTNTLEILAVSKRDQAYRL